MPDAYPPVASADGKPRPRWWHHAGMRGMAALAPGWKLYDQTISHTEFDRDLLRKVQTERLREVLGIDSAAVDPFDALAVRPIMSKQHFSRSGMSTGRVDPVDGLRVRTSGTTGVPIVIEHTDAHLVENVAVGLRMLSAYGFDPGVRILRVTCDRRHGLVSFHPESAMVTATQLRVNVSKLDEDNASFVNELCRAFAPKVIWGQPMEMLVAAAKVRAGLLANPQVEMVWTHGDTLGPQTRGALQEVFQTLHRDLFGLQEFGQVAWECPQESGTYHLNEERVLVEQDTDGALVMTNLVNTATAIIRYRPEDRADILDAACACGRTLRRVTGIQGRQRGFIVDRDDNPVNVKPLQTELDALPINRWQVTQESPGVISVAIVPADGEVDLDFDALSGRYARMLNLAAVDVRRVALEDLMTQSGKAPHFRLYATQNRYASELVPHG